MKKLVLFFVCALLFTFPQITVASNDHLVISQVQLAGSTADDEFIEIYNPTDSPISINGWSVQYKSSSGDFPLTSGKKNLPDASIPSHGYFLVANSGYTGTVLADVSHSSFSMSAASTGATIFLVNNSSFLTLGSDAAIVDKVGYGTGSQNSPEGSPALIPPSGQTLSRTDGVDTDDNSLDLSISTANPHNSSFVEVMPDPTPTPVPTPTPAPTGGGSATPSYSNAVLISEFLPNPDGSDTGEEWVEFQNPTSSAIDISGWYLDDESRDGTLGTSAYKLPAGTVIAANNFLALDLPEGSFALDNTGGDVLRLIWPDKSLASQVTYSGNSPEDTTYARATDGTYAWTKTATKGSENKFDTQEQITDTQDEIPQTASFINAKVKINEVLPNPAGTDSGKEWVELINTGTEAVSLHDWILDDGDKDDSIGSSAYHIGALTLSPGAVTTIVIPSGKFAMNNTGNETVRLFSPDKALVDAVTYTTSAREDQSYALFASAWRWGAPTQGAQNTSEEISETVVINEVFPYPGKGTEEFIEILNISDKSIDLAGYKLKDQNGSYTILAQVLEPGKVAVIKRSQSQIALANTAKENLELISPEGKVVSALEYDDAPKNSSFARTDEGDYEWTVLVTPAAVNKFKSNGQGKVEGATLIRTGNSDKSDPTLMYFALFAIIWYIAKAIVNPEGETENE